MDKTKLYKIPKYYNLKHSEINHSSGYKLQNIQEIINKNMKFKIWLNETNSNNLYSWLSPQGEFFPVYNSHHTEYAIKLIPEITDKHINIKNPAEARDLLFEKGWMRITYEKKSTSSGLPHITIYVNNSTTPPNRIQKAELIDFAIIKQNVFEIIYDNDTNEKTIWTKE
jgi:hypothetical protein